MTTWIEDGISRALTPIETSRKVIVSRYPFTMAYDFVRSHSEAFNAPRNMSRADTAEFLAGRLAGSHSGDADYVAACRRLADAYIVENSEVWPEGESADAVIARMGEKYQRSFSGSNSARQSVGDPGHCEDCVTRGHVAAHPELGCSDVGCSRHHGDFGA